MKVFLDSSFLISYAIATDENHKLAIKIKKKGIFDNECYISNLVINEIVTVIGNKVGLNLAVNTYNAIKDNCSLINEHNIENFNDKVLTIYKNYNSKLSFTDCAILETMKKNNIKKIASFDKHFKNKKNIKIIQ
jgi:predicted nucleic acid-binding protein